MNDGDSQRSQHITTATPNILQTGKRGLEWTRDWLWIIHKVSGTPRTTSELPTLGCLCHSSAGVLYTTSRERQPQDSKTPLPLTYLSHGAIGHHPSRKGKECYGADLTISIDNPDQRPNPSAKSIFPLTTLSSLIPRSSKFI